MLILAHHLINPDEMVIKSNFKIFVSLLILVFIASCSQPMEEKLAGEWRAVDVKIDSEEGEFSREQIDAIRRMEKSVVFVFNEDGTMNAVTGGSVISGVWEFNEETSEVSILIENAGTEPTLFGVYKSGQIIKDHEAGGISVTTVYEKKD
jgi:hypothetical protein